MIAVRHATQADCSFLSEIILLAESTGFEIVSYSKMFSKTNEELSAIFSNIINNNTNGHPLAYQSFLIVCVNDIPAAAISLYKEGEYGDSNHLMTGALMTGFDRREIANAFSFLKMNSDINIPKKINSLQIDSVATLPAYRRKGFLTLLLAEAEKIACKSMVDELQIQVWKKNDIAVKSYEKYGYKVVSETSSKTNDGNGKVLMQKIIHIPNKFYE